MLVKWNTPIRDDNRKRRWDGQPRWEWGGHLLLSSSIWKARREALSYESHAGFPYLQGIQFQYCTYYYSVY